MTVDLVTDLELDQDRYLGQDEPSAQRLAEIRAYLGSYYQVSRYNNPQPLHLAYQMYEY